MSSICEHYWVLHGNGAACTMCGVLTPSIKHLAAIDVDAAHDLVDPTGVQRDFLEATGLQPSF